jgi:propanol-preferring alcohol dehydrogenase
MKAMILPQPGSRLEMTTKPDPLPGPGQLQVSVSACGVCRTDLHVVDGDLSDAKLPIIPGHEIVGTVSALGDGVDSFRPGDRVGIPWLGHSCGSCSYCGSGAENLCDDPGFTGYQIDGGYADMTIADARFCFALPDEYGDAECAPLLCAGLIGYRSLLMAGDDSMRLGIYGFGAAAHIVAQVAVYQQREIYAFTSPGDTAAQAFALEMGAVWAGDSDTTGCLTRGTQGRHRRLRRYPYVRYSELPLRHSVGGARAAFGGEPDAPGCGRFSRAGA